MAGKGKKGRLTKLTDDVQAKIVDAVADGAPLKFAAEAAGVNERSVVRWMARGRNNEKPFRAFLSAVKAAESKCVHSSIKTLLDHGKTSWQAKAWWLERRFPDHFGTESRVVKELKNMLLSLTKGGHAVDPATKAKGKTGHGRAIDGGD